MIDFEKIIEELSLENQRRENLSGKDCYEEFHAKKNINMVDLYRTFKYFFKRELDSAIGEQFINERISLDDNFIDRANAVISILDDMQESLESDKRNIPVSSWKDIINLNIQKSFALKESLNGNGFDFSKGNYKGLEKNLGYYLDDFGSPSAEAILDK
jgi:hypothetical protein